MIEVVKKTGYIYSPIENKNYDPEFFYHMVEHAQPFVFAPSKQTGPQELPEVMSEEKYDAPFKVWSAEFPGQTYVTVSRPDDPIAVDIDCILAFEQPKQGWFYFALTKVKRGLQESDGVILITNLDGVVKSLVDRMNSNTDRFGTENVREKIKVGSGKSKRFITIRKVIHVRPKSQVTEHNSETGKIIEWGHRWWVRGAWHHFWLDKEKTILDTSRIGKDRDGNYCEQGRTWHVEHVKGPEDKPLVTKTRIIHGK
jgi:hypothetical protein